MAKAKLSDTKGTKLNLDLGIKKVGFTAGGKKRVVVGGGMVMVNGEVRDEKGNRYYAILELDEGSGGEYYGGLVFMDGGVKEIVDSIGKHQYKYHSDINCYDHHVGDDGWSR